MIVSQSLVESVLLAITGGIVGLVVTDGVGRLLLVLAFHSAHFLPINTDPSLPVLTFAFALSLFTGVLFGTAPAWFATRTDPAEALRGLNRSTRDNSSLSQKALLVAQAALSVVLVFGASVLARSLHHLEHQSFGLETNHRVIVNLSLPPAVDTPEHLDALYRNLEDRLKRLPGVESTGLALYNPFTGNWSNSLAIEGQSKPLSLENSGASWDSVTSGYLAAAGQKIVRGRGFAEADTGRSAPVAVVNQAFVRKFFPKTDPIDKHFGMDLPKYAGTFRIVGVVSDAKYAFPTRPVRPMFFVSLTQRVAYEDPDMQRLESRSHLIHGALLVTRQSPGTLEPLLRKAFSDIDPDIVIHNVRTMQQQIDLNFNQQRAVASLAGLFGVVALILAAVGLYGVTAYTVAQRTSEICIRMALGADRTNVVQLILRGAFQNVALGLLLGVPLAIGAGKLISSQLYGVTHWDPWAFSVAIGSLGVCAFVATMIPAARAATIDPMRALRTE